MTTDITTTPLAILPDIYHAVRIGMWIDIDGSPVWACDIAMNMDGGPDAVVGQGATLQEALDKAAANLVAFVEGRTP